MKYLIFALLITGCATLPYYSGERVKVIKYVQFGQVQWDFCDHVGQVNGLPFYVKIDGEKVITNYLKNDFKEMTMADYDRERKK